MFDDDVQLEAEELSHCRSSAFGQIFEDAVTRYGSVVAHRQLAAIGEINLRNRCLFLHLSGCAGELQRVSAAASFMPQNGHSKVSGQTALRTRV